MPEMDRPSIMYARLLDAVAIEDPEFGEGPPLLVCQPCREIICKVEDGDTVRVLLNTALAHECEGSGF